MANLRLRSVLIRTISISLIVSMTQPLAVLPAIAGMVSTETIIDARGAGRNDRQRVHDFLRRAEVRKQIESYGISADEAIQRVNSLTDAEIARLAGKLDLQPAGAGFFGGGTCSSCYTGSAGAQLAFVVGLILFFVLLFYFFSSDDAPDSK